MKNAWMALVVMSLTVGGLQAAERRPVAGVIVAVDGKPQLTTPKGKTGAVKVRDFVYEGDRLETKKGQRVAIALNGGAEFRMDEDSTFEVRSGGGGNRPASLFTSMGQAWTRLLGKSAKVNVRTPLAVAAVRGTEADIDFQGATGLMVKVYDGHVDLLDAEETKTLQTIRAGQTAEVGVSGQAGEVKALAKSDYGTWQGEVIPDGDVLQKQLKRLEREAERTKTLKFQHKDGTETDLPLQKKR